MIIIDDKAIKLLWNYLVLILAIIVVWFSLAEWGRHNLIIEQKSCPEVKCPSTYKAEYQTLRQQVDSLCKEHKRMRKYFK